MDAESPLSWWAGALIVWSATAIIAAYVRRRGPGWAGLLVGALVAVVAGALAGWRLWDDPWLGGVAGLTGACSPWLPDLAIATVKRLLGKVGAG